MMKEHLAETNALESFEQLIAFDFEWRLHPIIGELLFKSFWSFSFGKPALSSIGFLYSGLGGFKIRANTLSSLSFSLVKKKIIAHWTFNTDQNNWDISKTAKNTGRG